MKIEIKPTIKLMNGQPILYSTGIPQRHICCDCGLEHLVLYRIINNCVEETVYRNDWRTSKNRQRKKNRARGKMK